MGKVKCIDCKKSRENGKWVLRYQKDEEVKEVELNKPIPNSRLTEYDSEDILLSTVNLKRPYLITSILKASALDTDIYFVRYSIYNRAGEEIKNVRPVSGSISVKEGMVYSLHEFHEGTQSTVRDQLIVNDNGNIMKKKLTSGGSISVYLDRLRDFLRKKCFGKQGYDGICFEMNVAESGNNITLQGSLVTERGGKITSDGYVVTKKEMQEADDGNSIQHDLHMLVKLLNKNGFYPSTITALFCEQLLVKVILT